jgi:competence protein ComEA
MSDDPLDLEVDLVRPEPPRSWRDQVSAFAESLDLSPRRLVVGLVAVAVAALLAWRLLAPADPAPELELPYASASSGAAEGAGGEAAGGPSSSAGAAGSSIPGSTAGATPAASGSTVPTEVVVHVAGAVRSPGVQHLPGGARVVDAVDAAGGANPDADLARINLAAPLQDGQQIYVPRVGETPPTPVGGSGGTSSSVSGGSGSSSSTGSATGQPVNINTASADELDTLPGVGPTTAEAIIAYREQNGPFTSVDQLLDVRGIGDAKLEQLRNLVTI